jgi:hypothetical protein
MTSVIESHDNHPDNTPDATQNNTDVYYQYAEGDNPGVIEYPLYQDMGELSGFPPGTIGKLGMDIRNAFRGVPGSDIEYSPVQKTVVKLQVGGQYLREFEAGVRSNSTVLKGEGKLPVNELKRAIPKGTKVPIGPSINRDDLTVQDPNQISDPDLQGDLPKSFITLSRRAERGDDVLRGEISKDVDPGWVVRYAGFTSTESFLDFFAWKPEGGPWNFDNMEVFFPFTAENGDTLSGQAEIEIGAYEPGDYIDGDNEAVKEAAWIDNIEFGLEKDGSTLAQTAVTATVEAAGKDVSVTSRSSQGPTDGNLSRLRVLKPSGGTLKNATDWKVGAYSSGESASGVSLKKLYARQRLRFFRNHRERLEVTYPIRQKAPLFSGDEVVQVDGKTYTISSLSLNQNSLTVGLLRHEDGGVSNITYLRRIIEEDDASSGSSVASGGGGRASSQDINWNTLEGNLSGNVPIVPETDSNGDITELHGIAYSSASPEVKWTRDPANSFAFKVQDTSNSNTLAWITESGDIHAKGEIQAFSDGSGSSSTTHSELQILDDGSTETMDAKSLNIIGGDVTESGDDVTLDLSNLGGGTDFQAGNLLSFDTSTDPDTLDVHSKVPRLDLDETVSGQWTFGSMVSITANTAPLLEFDRTSNSNIVDVLGIRIGGGSDATFRLYNETDGNDIIMAQANGRVGIGKKPGYALDVDGVASFGRRLKVTGAEDEYKNLTLEDTTSGEKWQVSHRKHSDGNKLTLHYKDPNGNWQPNFKVRPDGDLEVYGTIVGDNGTLDFVGSHTNWAPSGGDTSVDFRMRRGQDNNDAFRSYGSGGIQARNIVSGDGGRHRIAQFALDASSTVSNGFGGYIAIGQVRDSGQMGREGARVGSYIVSGADTAGDTHGFFVTVRDDDTYREVITTDNKGNTYFRSEVEAYDSSDQRLKENFAVVENPLDTLSEVTGYHFDWNEDSPDYKPDSGYGLVAQEVQKVLPEAVRENADGYLGLQYEQLHAYEVEAIKQLKRENEELREEVNELKSELR